MKKILISIGIIIAVIIGIGVYSDMQNKQDVKVAEINYEKASANVIESAVEMHYVYEGKYPRSLKDLTDTLKVDINQMKERNLAPSEQFLPTLEKSIKDLKSLEYKVRGDDQAYQFTYTDFDGKTQTITGNYNKDFH